MFLFIPPATPAQITTQPPTKPIPQPTGKTNIRNTKKVEPSMFSAQPSAIPDWQQITFAKLLPFERSGIAGERVWHYGQPVDQFLTLADFQDSFKLQFLNLYTIAKAAKIPAVGFGLPGDADSITLASFKLFRQQSLSDLVTAIPALGNLPAIQIAPIAALLRADKPEYQLEQQTPLAIVVQDPAVGQLTFENFDLSSYSVKDIPGLKMVPLQAFRGWQFARITDVPYLSQVPWSAFLVPPQIHGMSGVLNLKAAAPFTTVPTISGSNVAGYQSSCSEECTGATFSSPMLLQGKYWLVGDQTVAGRNNETEPTGRNPFGEAFKVVISSLDPNQMQTSIFFHVCGSGDNPVCGAYSVGPVPWFTYHNGDSIFVGRVTEAVSQVSQIPEIPSEIPQVPIRPGSPNSLSVLLALVSQAVEYIQRLFQGIPYV